MFDYHLHSSVSFDGKASPQSMIEAAKNAGLREICFTDHRDIRPNGDDNLAFTAEEYHAAYDSLREAGGTVKLRFGAEIESVLWDDEKYYEFLGDLEFDFVICSQHFAREEDPYFPAYFEGRTKREAYGMYFEDIIESVKKRDGYSVFGHLTYPTKNCPLSDPIARYSEFADMYDEILKSIIARGKGIEVNTSGLRTSSEPLPPIDVVKRYAELGGEILTIGSDAHTSDKVGFMIPEVLERLRQAGVKYICTFEKMKPEFHKI